MCARLQIEWKIEQDLRKKKIEKEGKQKKQA